MTTTAASRAPAASWPTGWHAVVDHLEHAGVTTVFGLPADDLGLLTALDPTGIRLVLCRDQRNAVFMATGHALQSGRPAVCVVGKGPAVTNTMTGLLEATASAVPLVVLAAGTAVERRGSGAFQELDQLAVVAPLVKWAARVDHPSRLVPTLEKAFLVATSGAPGPVYVEVPDHLLTAPVEQTRPWAAHVSAAFPADIRVTTHALDAVRAAQRPVVLVGGGMRHGGGGPAVERLAARLGAPVFATASGRGTVNEDSALFCGLAGLYSPPEMAELWRTTDLVIALGSRLEETATLLPGFAPAHVPVVQVNVDPAEFSAEWTGSRVLGDAAGVVAAWSDALGEGCPDPDVGWVAAVLASRAALFARGAAERKAAEASGALTVPQVLTAMDRLAPPSRVLVQENGLADMWSYFFPRWSCHAEGGSVVPSEQTSLGFGAAAAAGVALAAPGRRVVALVGDGAFGMVRGDLQTLVDEGIAVLYVVLANGGYGWLQSQADALATPMTRFRFVRDTPELGAGLPAAVWSAVVRDRSALDGVLVGALAACEAGLVAVVEVPVQLSDAALADAHPGGDFPTAGAGGAPC